MRGGRGWFFYASGLLLSVLLLLVLIMDRPEAERSLRRTAAPTGAVVVTTPKRELDESSRRVAESSSRPMERERASSEGRSSLLRVLDGQSRAPIVGATVWSSGDVQVPCLLGDTDENGVLELHGSIEALTVERKGFATATEVPRDTAADGQLIVMWREARITGQLLDVRGVPTPKRPLLLAYREGSAPSKSSILSWHARRWPGLHITRADRLGAFEFTGLQHGERYTLAVAGEGLVLPERRPGVLAGETGVALVVRQLFGAVIQVVHVGGEPLRTSSRLWALPGPQWTWPEREWRGLATDSLEGALCGLDAAETSRDWSGRFVWLFWTEAPSEPDELGPIRFAGHLAGYEPVEVDVELPQVINDLAEVRLELTPTATEWGELRVSLLHGDSLSPGIPTSVRGGVGDFVLKSADTGQMFIRTLADFVEDEIWLEGVPAAEYLLYLTSKHGAFNSAQPAGPIHVRIEGGREHAATIDLSELCSVRFDVDSGGGAYKGDLGLEIHRLDTPSSTFVSFENPPYVLRGLSKGQYRFTMYVPALSVNDDWVSVTQPGRSAEAATVQFSAP
jgi:hypothetical protein